MEDETDPNQVGVCEKIFQALSVCPTLRPLQRRISNTTTDTATPNNTAPTTTVDREIEIEQAPLKHKPVPPPPAPPLGSPESKTGPKEGPAQPPIKLQDKSRPAVEDMFPTKSLPGPPQEKSRPTQMTERVIPVEPTAAPSPKKVSSPVKGGPPTIPALPVPPQEKLQPIQAKEKVEPMGPAAPATQKIEATPMKMAPPAIPAASPIPRPAPPPAASPVVRPVVVAAPEANKERDNAIARAVPPAPPPVPPAAQPTVVAPPRASNERENVELPLVVKEIEQADARAELTAAPTRGRAKGPMQRTLTGRVEEYLARAGKNIRTRSNAGAAAQSMEPKFSQTNK